MEIINDISVIPCCSSSVQLSQPQNPELQFLIKQIDDMITKAQEALKALEQKIDEDLGAIKGFLSSMGAEAEQLMKSSDEVNELQQKCVALKYGINELLSLKDQLQKLKFSDFMKELSSIETEVQNELNKIRKLIN